VFDIGWTEMLVIAVVMILVVGPKDLPGMLRTIGKTIGNLRRMAGDFQRQFSDALKEADIDEVKKDLTQSTSMANLLDDPLSDITKSADELMGSLDTDDDGELAKEKFDKIQAEITEGKAKEGKAKLKSAAVTTSKTATSRKKPVRKAPAKKAPAKIAGKSRPAVKKPATKKSTTVPPAKFATKPVAKLKPSPKSKSPISNTMTGSKTA